VAAAATPASSPPNNTKNAATAMDLDGEGGEGTAAPTVAEPEPESEAEVMSLSLLPSSRLALEEMNDSLCLLLGAGLSPELSTAVGALSSSSCPATMTDAYSPARAFWLRFSASLRGDACAGGGLRTVENRSSSGGSGGAMVVLDWARGAIPSSAARSSLASQLCLALWGDAETVEPSQQEQDEGKAFPSH
jgi:hypothetical protein